MKRLLNILLDPKAIAGLFLLAVPAIIAVFNLTQYLPDSIKKQAKPEVLTPIVTLAVWIFLAILFALFDLVLNLRRHPDGKPKPGKVAIYVAELRGDKENSHRKHIVDTLTEQLGETVQILHAGKEFCGKETGNPGDDALDANRKGQLYLDHKKYKGDLLIWGQVIKDSQVVKLRFTSPAYKVAAQGRFTFDQEMLLTQKFDAELAAALAAIAAQLALPAVNPGKYVGDVLIPVAEKLGKIVANLPESMRPDQRGLLLRSYALAEFTIGEQRGDSDALKRAIAAYREALKERTREKVPLDWAMTQNNLGNAFLRLGQRESGTEQLEAAITAYREALKEYTREKVPLLWAMTQNNLGTVLSTLGERNSGTEQLEAAVAAYCEALKEYTQEKVPLDWAMTQNNLGLALWRLGEREGNTERLETAVVAYREALKEYTRERVPLQWATTQNNLGLALWRLGERESGTEQLEAAVAAYREALKEYTREKVPLDWAMTQNNLGTVLWTLGERESGTEQLEAAVAAYREALKEYTREKVPLDWAMTQNNLGAVLWTLGQRESGTEQLEAAVAAYREALKEWTREKVPLQWAMTQNNLGTALSMLGEREGNTERLHAAVAAYREALKERTREKVPLDWAMTQNNLGHALEWMGELDDAADAYRLALEVFTPENHFPRYTGTAGNLARVQAKLRAAQMGEDPQPKSAPIPVKNGPKSA